MAKLKKSSDDLSPLLTYLAKGCTDGERIPSLTELADQLDISIATLREQLEAARLMGIVEVKPKTGIRRMPYTFRESVRSSLAYAVEITPAYFPAYADLRRHLEAAYWYEAVVRLTPDDHYQMKYLVRRAFEKLSLNPPQNPQFEHRELHLIMYRRLDNLFVTGLLETFWETYEAVGLDVIQEMDYLQSVWRYHQKIVDAICAGDYEAGFQALREHMDLLNQRPKIPNNQKFE